MQNHLVSYTVKSLLPTLPSQIGKGISSLSPHRCVTPSLPNDLSTRDFSDRRASTLLLPGGGLEKFQGRFKEEQYFNANDHILVAQIRKTGYRLKCEEDVSNWTEFERMATACAKIFPQRKTDMVNKTWSNTEESFFLQEQKSLLDRIIEVIKRLTSNRGGGPSYGSPFGPYYHHPYGTPFQRDMGGKNVEENVEKTDEETTLPDEKTEETSSEQDAETKDTEQFEENKNEEAMEKNDWHGEHERNDHDDHGSNGEMK